MSKFLKALEQAERDHALREQARQQGRVAVEWKGPAARTPSEESPAAAAPAAGPSLSDPPVAEPPAKEETVAVESGAPEKLQEARVKEHLVSLLHPASFEAEQYRTLRYIVESMQKEARLRVVAVTSAGVGDGKTTTAINLAGALAQSPEARVLLVDMDLRRATLAEHLGIDNSNGPGLVDAILRPTLTLDDIEWFLPAFNLSILAAGRSPTSPYEILKSPRLAEILADARQRYDYIVLDTPPIVPVPDCRVISKWVDASIMVVSAHKTPRKLVEEALNAIDPAKVLGIIFNNDDRPLSGYYGYYYGKGQSASALAASGLDGRRQNIVGMVRKKHTLGSRIRQVRNLVW